MEVTNDERKVVADAYARYKDVLVRYVGRRVEDRLDAEDMVQDAFVRLLGFDKLICESTVRSFLFVIVRNLLTDYYRRRQKKQECQAYLYKMEKGEADFAADQTVYVSEILKFERRKVDMLPMRRREIYSRFCFGYKPLAEIAGEMGISFRTAEKHLAFGRKNVRAYLKAVGCAD